jgi:hypothetical protein
MMMMGGKRRAGRASILAAEVHRTPFAAFQGVGLLIASLILGVLLYEGLKHKNNALMKNNILLSEENRRLEQQIIRSKSAKSNLTAPNNQFLERLRNLSLDRVSAAHKRTISRKTLIAWYDKALWDSREEELGVMYSLPQMAGSGIPSIEPVAVAFGREPGSEDTGLVMD